MKISEIQRAFIKKQLRYTKHGLEQRINRHISSQEIEDAVLNGEIIEDYPSDKYGPSCLVYGKTGQGKPLHIQIAFSPIMSVVTIYEPNPKEWINNKIRR